MMERFSASGSRRLDSGAPHKKCPGVRASGLKKYNHFLKRALRTHGIDHILLFYLTWSNHKKNLKN